MTVIDEWVHVFSDVAAGWKDVSQKPAAKLTTVYCFKQLTPLTPYVFTGPCGPGGPLVMFRRSECGDLLWTVSTSSTV
jgi:hypothetical protein